MLLLDRYEIGERQTSACAAPTEWLEALGLEGSIRQTFDRLVIHTPHTTVALPAAVDLLDLRLPGALRAARRPERRRVRDRHGRGARPPRGETRSRSTPTAASCPRRSSWTRSAGGGCWAPTGYQPPGRAAVARASRCTRTGRAASWRSGSTARSSRPATAGASPPRDEVRVGVGSFDPRFHVKEPTVELAERLRRDAVRYQGNWIPHRLRAADRGRRVLRRRLRRPLPAADRRGHPHRVLLRHRPRAGAAPGAGGRAHARRRAAPLRRLLRPHEWQFRWMLRAQRLVPRVPPRAAGARAAAAMANRASPHWAFEHYLEIAHPSFVGDAGAAPGAGCRAGAR